MAYEKNKILFFLTALLTYEIINLKSTWRHYYGILYGMLLANPIWQHGFLLAAWFALHLMSYPFLNLFKGRNLALYRWSWIYGIASMVFALAGMGAYYFPDRIFDYNLRVALYPTLYFIGTILYVKSMMRERKKSVLSANFAGISCNRRANFVIFAAILVNRGFCYSFWCILFCSKRNFL